MRQRLPAILLLTAMLAGCAPGAEVTTPPDGRDVYTDWSKLTPYVSEQTENIASRWYGEFTDHLIPRDDYGQLLPFRGARLARRYEPEWDSWDLELYGLVTKDGKIVVDPVLHDAYQPSWYGAGQLLPLMVLGMVEEWDGEQVKKYALADSQGRWVTEFRYLSCSAVGPHGVVALEEGGDCVLLDVNGQEKWRIQGLDQFWFWDNGWFDGMAMVSTAEELLLLDTFQGKVLTLLDGQMNPQTFSDGLAATYDASNRCGYIDRTGQWVIEPTYSWGDSFSAGRALVERDGVEYLINREGQVLRTGQGDLRRCQSRTGDWIVDVRRGGDDKLTVLGAYDLDGAPLSAPAVGVVLEWGARLYEKKAGTTVVWDGSHAVTLPVEGHVEDVSEDYVLLSDDAREDCALVSWEGEVVIPYGTVGMLYQVTDPLTGEIYFQTASDAKELVLILEEDGSVLVSSAQLYGGLLRIGAYSGDTAGYMRTDGTWVFRYTMVDGGDI